jgi:hypothetical protein
MHVNAIGNSWGFGFKYLSGLPSDSALGDGFQYAQNVSIGILPDGDITLYNGNHTTETFDYVAANNFYSSVNNNTAAILTMQGTGAQEEYILSASNGSVSTFYGFDPGTSTINTPGQLKSFADRYGNEMQFTWVTSGGGTSIQLESVTDSSGRVIEYTYYGSTSKAFSSLRLRASA